MKGESAVFRCSCELPKWIKYFSSCLCKCYHYVQIVRVSIKVHNGGCGWSSIYWNTREYITFNIWIVCCQIKYYKNTNTKRYILGSDLWAPTKRPFIPKKYTTLRLQTDALSSRKVTDFEKCRNWIKNFDIRHNSDVPDIVRTSRTPLFPNTRIYNVI